MKKEKMNELALGGILSSPDAEPYLVLYLNKKSFAELTLEQARKVANDILAICARTEADSLVYKFFREHDLPEDVMSVLVHALRASRPLVGIKDGAAEDAETGWAAYDCTKTKPQ